MSLFEGLYPALITPFHADGTINRKAIEQIVEINLKKGVDGFYVSGSTGESYLLSIEERKEVLEAVVQAVSGRGKVIANIGMFATEHSMELAMHAKTCGVDAISSVPPFYFPFTKEEYRTYYFTLAERTYLPVIVYNVPALSSVTFTLEELRAFLDDERVAGIKHTTYDLYTFQRLVEGYPGKSIFIGHDEIFLSALAAGAKAGIGSTYNIMSEKFVRMRLSFAAGKVAEALKVQNEVNEVIEVLMKVGVFKGVKEILKMQGIDCGDCRRPFAPLGVKEKAMLKAVAKKNGLF